MTVSEDPRILNDNVYSYGYLDEDTKRMIRRAILKAVAIPGYQVPFGSREMPLPYGWGTGGIQITASLIGPDDTVKVIDQGADDTTNAVSIRSFFRLVAGVRTTRSTRAASIVQTRHRIPETPLRDDQILVFQVPHPEPMRELVARESETRRLHALGDYGVLYVKLYEDIARFGRAASAYNHPVLVNRHYVASPSPIPKFDNPKLNRNRALMIFGAGRENRIYAIPPFSEVTSLAFEDHPFGVPPSRRTCTLCGSSNTFLDEIAAPDGGDHRFVCSDTDFCQEARSAASDSRARSAVTDAASPGTASHAADLAAAEEGSR